MCRYELDLVAVLRLTGPCYAVASVLPKAVLPTVDRSKTSNSVAKEEPSLPCMNLPVMPLTLLACGGKILLYECIADPEQLQVGARFSSAMQAFESAAERVEEDVSQVMDGIVSAASGHVDARVREHQEPGDGTASLCVCAPAGPWFVASRTEL